MLSVSIKALCWLLVFPNIGSLFISSFQPCTSPRKIPQNTPKKYFSESNMHVAVSLKQQQKEYYLSATTDPNSSVEDEEEEEINGDELYMERFRRRLQETRLRQAARIELLPPNPSFVDPCDFVTAILNELRREQQQQGSIEETIRNNDGTNNLGLRVLLRSSTPEWRNSMHRSVGAPLDMNEDSVTAALRSTLGRSNNQFNILLGKTKSNVSKNNGNGGPDTFEYNISFPNDPVDYDDGMCWIECRLRDVQNDELLVAMGWTLRKRKEDGAWLIHSIDWQDFRDQFRPGIGREEWERICG